jgi:hypothetical protein
MRGTTSSLVLVLALAAGCYVQPEVEYPYVDGPDLVAVEPGVEVVAGYDYPVFFVDGLYWLWWDGFWYSSRYWNHGWGHQHVVPSRITGIHHPDHYSHFQPSRTYSMRRAPGYTTRPTPGYGQHPRHFVAPPQHATRAQSHRDHR